MPRGRPTPPPTGHLTELVPADQTPGRNVTIGEYIIEQLHAGVDLYNAAATAGVLPPQLQAWLREGTLGFNRLNNGADWTTDFTPDEQDIIIFAVNAQRANGRHIARLAVDSERIARGGLVRTKVTEQTDANGNIVLRSETNETLLPDADMIRWKLERLAPEVYGTKASLNVTVVDLTDTPDVADDISRRFAAIEAQLAPPTPTDG